MKENRHSAPITQALRWTARIMSAGYLAFFLLFLIAHLISGPEAGTNPVNTREAISFVFVFAYFAGLLAAWKWERPGALMALMSIIAFMVTLQDEPSTLHLFMSVPALLFAIAAFLSRGKSASKLSE